MVLEERFFALLGLAPGHVLEIGVRRSQPDRPTTWRDRINALPGCTHVGVDCESGDDVDLVVDAHQLSQAFAAATFDALVCRFTLEHLRRPWVAAREMALVCKPGALGYVLTHQSFPLHGYPQDFFRFSQEAIGELFAPDMGWRVLESGYDRRCKIAPTENLSGELWPWNFEADGWLCVAAVVERTR